VSEILLVLEHHRTWRSSVDREPPAGARLAIWSRRHSWLPDPNPIHAVRGRCIGVSL